MQNIVPHRETGHDSSAIQVIDRAVALLRLLQASDRPLGLGELSIQAGLSKSTTHRILASLEQHRLCERESEGVYRLGLGLMDLGMAVRDRLDLRQRSRVHLDRLAERTALTIYLCVREGDRAVCIERIDGRYADSLALRLGGSLPLHAGASARTVLAHLSDDELQAYLERHDGAFERLTERTLTSRDAILADARAARERGWSIAEEDVAAGTCAIGAPIFDHTGQVAAGLSISGIASQVQGERQDELVSLALHAGAEISRALGFSEPTGADDETRAASA
jgi:DNA-binding IclR family transcriptional regulator